MAARAIDTRKQLILKVPFGMTSDGKQIIRRVTFKGVIKTATYDDLFSVAREIEKVLASKLDSIVLGTEEDLISA